MDRHVEGPPKVSTAPAQHMAAAPPAVSAATPAARESAALALLRRLVAENRKGCRPEIWSALYDEASALLAKGA